MPRILCYIDIRGILPIRGFTDSTNRLNDKRKECYYVTVPDRMPAGVPGGIC